MVQGKRPILGENLEKASAILGGAPISFAYQDADLRYLWFENAPTDWNSESAIGHGDAELFPETVSFGLIKAKKDVLDAGIPTKRELSLTGDDGPRYYDVYLQPDRDPSGAVVGILSSFVDITDRRRSEEARHILLREVTHRSKNLLAIVTSLAAQTSRTAKSIDDFLDRFNGRLQSMARSQDIVTATNWRGARLSELIATQVEPFAPDGSEQVVLTGRDPYLKPNAALYVGLALHELAANSVRKGVLASPHDKVDVSVSTLPGFAAGEPTTPALGLVWAERRDGGIEGPEAAEFGRVLLTRLVPAAVGGSAEFTDGAEGLRYELTLLRGEFE